jgi:hypothetical protein
MVRYPDYEKIKYFRHLIELKYRPVNKPITRKDEKIQAFK